MDLWIALLVAAVILAPVLWFLGGFIFKVLWSIWPGLASVAAGGYILWTKGMQGFIALPASLLFAILFVWLWQRTSTYLRVDEKIGRATLLD